MNKRDQLDMRSLETKIAATGHTFFEAVRGEAPSVFNKSFWTGKVMDWAMQNEGFRVQLFRFVDVLPCLTTSASLQRHIEEYFAGGDGDVPPVLKWSAEKSGVVGGLTGGLTAKVMGAAVRKNIESMAKSFIIGQNTKEAVKSIRALRKDGFTFAADLLGEATVSEVEADDYMNGYLELLAALKDEQRKWKALDSDGDLDWGARPKVEVSVKPSAFYSQAKPADIQGSAAGILSRLKPVYRAVIDMNGALCVDMESLKHKEITIELFKQLRSDPEFLGYPHLSLALQSYLRDTDQDLENLLAWARTENLAFGLRLVKGAYWDYESFLAKQNGWEVPVWSRKPETDMAFERQSVRILENSDLIYFQCASHNIRSISAVLEAAKAMGVSQDRYEFQVLYGMAEPVRRALQKVVGRVRLYCPYGELLPGMAYLVRRLLENTANESFLRRSFADGLDEARLMENPEKTLERELGCHPITHPKARETGDIGPFRNHELVDFTIPEIREAFPTAIAEVRSTMGGVYPLVIGAREIETNDRIDSTNPADPDELIGSVCQAGVAEVDEAAAIAKKALATWRDTSPEDRAGYLLSAADIARKRAFALSALQVLEVGKQWDQAYHDVGEAIDFMEYYAREMIRLGKPRRMGNAPGEVNELFYQPKGVAAVIAPWNFPLAISCGMVSAAVVTGNPVIYKPSGLSSVIGYGLAELFREAGLPAGVFNYCPGRGSVMGDHLVDHPDIAIIAFTGSMEVGLRIQERAAGVSSGQTHCKRVIAEMGGKNAIIIDDDADLDEAVPQVLYSAFGFQGQKCSACSRVIVVGDMYDRFLGRLCAAASSLKIGPAEDPANFMGPVVDASQQRSIKEYIEIGRSEGRVVVESPVPDKGCFVPLTIVADIKPEHRLAQEEIFGPVLSVMTAKDFGEALDIANGTQFALTGGVFSRSPNNLERARREFRVGNLYFNRNNTGALVERQPFGGFKMSGVGSKAGGPDYLLQFMDPRCVTENTMRRGFAPIRDDDEWVC